MQRKLQGALSVCLAAAGLLSFVNLASAQAGAGGNPVDNLPTPQRAPAGNEPAGRILTAPQPSQPVVSRAVTPQRFDIEGVNAIPFDDVANLFKPLVNQPGTVAQLTELAKQCTALYQQHGFALSFCYVPQQEFAGGVVRVIAVEGHVETVKIEGDAGPAEARIRELAERIRADRPLTLAAFDRYTQLMSQLPGVQVQASATPPAATDGAGSMLLKVDRRPYGVSVGTDFRSSSPRAVLTGTVNDPIVAGGALSASTLVGTGNDERFYAGAYTQAVGTEGLTLKGELSMFKGDPDASRNITPAIRRYNNYRRAELSASYPLLLKRSESLLLSGGLYATNNTDDYTNPLNGARLRDDVEVRAVYAQAAYAASTPTQARALSLRLVQGLNGLGAEATRRANFTNAPLVNDARIDFTRVVLEGSQRNTWGEGGAWGTGISFATQYSPHNLPSTERISFGSTRFGRAYQAGEIAGDKGWGLGLELNRTFGLGMDYIKQVQPYVLLETAHTSLQSGTAAISKLTSASLGFRLTDNNYYRIDLAASKPLGDASPYNPSRDLRFSALLTYSFSKVKP